MSCSFGTDEVVTSIVSWTILAVFVSTLPVTCDLCLRILSWLEGCWYANTYIYTRIGSDRWPPHKHWHCCCVHNVNRWDPRPFAFTVFRPPAPNYVASIIFNYVQFNLSSSPITSFLIHPSGFLRHPFAVCSTGPKVSQPPGLFDGREMLRNNPKPEKGAREWACWCFDDLFSFKFAIMHTLISIST